MRKEPAKEEPHLSMGGGGAPSGALIPATPRACRALALPGWSAAVKPAAPTREHLWRDAVRRIWGNIGIFVLLGVAFSTLCFGRSKRVREERVPSLEFGPVKKTLHF